MNTNRIPCGQPSDAAGGTRRSGRRPGPLAQLAPERNAVADAPSGPSLAEDLGRSPMSWPERRGRRTVRPKPVREAWSTGAEVAGAPWQTRRPPPAGGGACADSSPWARTTYRSRGRSASRETVSGTILPATTTVERLCADALVDAERRTEARVAERVPPSRQAGGAPDAPRLARPWTEYGRFTERASS